MTLPVVFTANGQTGYNLTKSLRFRSSASAYLNRTLTTPTSSQKFTWSGWIKRGKLDSSGLQGIFCPYSSGTVYGYLAWYQDGIRIFDRLSGGTNYLLQTTAVYRDPSAWYHLVYAVDTTQATAANRVRLYVNGVEVTAFSSSTYPTQNNSTTTNSAIAHNIGYDPSNTGYFDGYQAELNFIDGQQLTPSSFGSTNATTGVWQPAKYTGTYGTNGFYLPFTNTTSTSTLGNDFSGNGNTWTTNNFSLTAGSTYDSMTDVPTLTSATTANYCVFNPLVVIGTRTITNGNLNTSITTGNNNVFASMQIPTSGKYYWEYQIPTIGSAGEPMAGVAAGFITDLSSAVVYRTGGDKIVNGTGSGYGATYTTTDTIGVAVDVGGSTVTFYKNNTSQGAISFSAGGLFPVVRSNVGSDVFTINFGQQGFTYTPPTGFVALNTFNLPTSTIVKGNTVMDATLYTGTLLSNAITNTAGFKPDLVWIKGRSAATDHKLTDSVRGTTKSLQSNDNGAEGTDIQGLTAFNTNGFTVGTSTNYNNLSATYVGWNWQAGQGSSSSNTSGSITSTVSVNATAGFSIATYTGNGTAGATIGHGLGVAPKMIIVKNRTAANAWLVYHSSIGATAWLELNAADGSQSNVGAWNNTAPTSSVFSVGTFGASNGSGNAIVAYCWSEIAGFSKFGSYVGNGSTDGTFVYLGFRPKFVIMKKSSAAEDWAVLDSSRSPYNVTTADLYPDLIQGEDVGNARADLLSNGIKFRTVGGQWNLNGATYIYMAFAENPFKNALAR
jgi:hypothetical protein